MAQVLAHYLSNGIILESVGGLDFSKWPLFAPEIYIFGHNFKTIIARRLILVARIGYSIFPFQRCNSLICQRSGFVKMNAF